MYLTQALGECWLLPTHGHLEGPYNPPDCSTEEEVGPRAGQGLTQSYTVSGSPAHSSCPPLPSEFPQSLSGPSCLLAFLAKLTRKV